jgi:PleD family two-component response regulator
MTKCYCGKAAKCKTKPLFLFKKNNGKILLLVKNRMLLLLHKMLFHYHGYSISVISRPEIICNYLKKNRPALIVFDMDIRKNLCKQIASHLKKAEIPTLLIISTGDECIVCKYLEPELCDYVDSLSDEIHLIIKKAERLMNRAGSKTRKQGNTKTMKHKNTKTREQ